jgi:hypothetical protein
MDIHATLDDVSSVILQCQTPACSYRNHQDDIRSISIMITDRQIVLSPEQGEIVSTCTPPDNWLQIQIRTSTSSLAVPGSREACPASGTMRKSISGHTYGVRGQSGEQQ